MVKVPRDEDAFQLKGHLPCKKRYPEGSNMMSVSLYDQRFSRCATTAAVNSSISCLYLGVFRRRCDNGATPMHNIA